MPWGLVSIARRLLVSGYEKGLVVEFGMHLDWVFDQSFSEEAAKRAPMPPLSWCASIRNIPSMASGAISIVGGYHRNTLVVSAGARKMSL
jgi:hypothetical protein